MALAATYVIDYARDEQLKTRASFHWKRAVHLLTRELSYPETCQPGKEDVIVAALFVFCVNEVVIILSLPLPAITDRPVKIGRELGAGTPQ